MTKSIFYCEYKLKKGTQEADFLQTAQALNTHYISQQPGYISWEQWHQDGTWIDIIAFETMEDIAAFEKNSEAPNAYAAAFYAHINMPSCKMRRYTVAQQLH